MKNTTNSKATTKASKATAKAAELDKVLTDTATASDKASKAADSTTTAAKSLNLGHTAEVIKMIADLQTQLDTYEEADISKALLKEITLFKGFTTDLDSSEKNQSEYNQKQAARLAAIYEKLSDIDEKKEKAAQKAAEAAKYAGLDKLTVKQNKAFAEYIAKLDSTTTKPLALRQNVQTISVGQFLESVENKTITIPSTQRGAVWTAEQIVKLFDSLINNYPIPALTTLATGGKANTLIDGLQRYTALSVITNYLTDSDNDALLDSIKAAYITINQITIDNSTIEIENDIFSRLNNGSQMAKGVVQRNTVTDKTTLFAVRDCLQNIAKNALKNGINLHKSAQIDNLAMYACGQHKAQKVTSLAPKSNAEMINNFAYTATDITTIYEVFAAIDKVIDILAATPFKGNIYNQNTLASCIYALLKLNATAEQIAENLQKIYTNKQGEPSKNAVDRWTATTKSGGTSSSNIEARAKMLIK